MTAALQHIKVVDLTSTLAGPFCTMMLGDMGADVIKIEEPERGDETRSWTPFWHEESTQFLSFNRNKRSLSLNLKAPEAVDIVLALARDADVMIESFRAGALERMGLGASMSYHATGYFATGVEPHRMGSGHPSLVPYQTFPAADGFFIVGCANQGLWERLCKAIGRLDLLANPRFKTNDDRVAHRAECVGTLSEMFRARPMADWVDMISQAGVPCGPINRVSDVVNDPQVLAREMIAAVPHPTVPELRMPNSPLKLTETPPSIRRPPPLLGQHNQEVLAELGYSPQQIAELRRQGVIGPHAEPL